MKGETLMKLTFTGRPSRHRGKIFRTLLMFLIVVSMLCSGCYVLEQAMMKRDMSEEELELARRFDRAHVKYSILQVSSDGRWNLDLRHNARFDLAILQDLAIDNLVLYKSHVSDLSPLQGMDIVDLGVSFTQVQDLSPLQGMPLKSLSIASTDVHDLAPLHGMSLSALWMQSTKVTDATPLQGMPLTYLFLDDTLVTDLSPLEDMSLSVLSLAGTPVDDLSPLQGLSLSILDISGTNITDISGLQDIPLRTLSFSPGCILHGIEEIRNMPTLEYLTTPTLRRRHPIRYHREAQEFWERYDAGEFSTCDRADGR
jgi:Leucine-rich repeat (LRR) protein